MFKNTKQPQYFKSFLLGMTAIALPIFSFNQDIPKAKADTVPDWKKVKNDYKKSTMGIQKEVMNFGYRK